MRWKVEVHGQSFDLADLVVAVGGLGASTFRDGEKTFLYTEAFEQMDTAAEVNHAAEALIGTINASLRLSDPAAQSLTVGPVVDAQGSRTHFACVMDGLRARGRAGAFAETLTGDVISQPPPTEPVLAKRARLIDSDADVAQAVKLLNADDETLGSLAKAFEIVAGPSWTRGSGSSGWRDRQRTCRRGAHPSSGATPPCAEHAQRAGPRRDPKSFDQ